MMPLHEGSVGWHRRFGNQSTLTGCCLLNPQDYVCGFVYLKYSEVYGEVSTRASPYSIGNVYNIVSIQVAIVCII